MSSTHVGSKSKKAIAALAFGALGVVYGDIGTSPLYAIKEVFYGHHPLEQTTASITGLISIVIWALILIVAVKYVAFVLRADNDGEGGVFALLALLRKYKTKSTLLLVGILTFAAGLLFADGVLTPAISVLSAVEGLSVATTTFNGFIIPIVLAIITALFLIQSQGTTKIGRLFGPIIFVWFISLAALGLRQIIMEPAILHALNPINAINFILDTKPYTILLALTSVMLVVTGGEALYADLGHFGRTPIRLSWFAVVMPCLMLNYLGQGAFLLSDQAVIGGNIFFSTVPSALLYPMVILATCATVIASQALISGAYSLAAQGIALGLLPRLRIKHTHEEHEGQIYIGAVNWTMYAACIMSVIYFKTSANLASAYVLAVSGVMIVTSIAAILVSIKVWKWSPLKAFIIFGFFTMLDLGFVAANSLKFFEGGWIPVVAGIFLFLVMVTWQWGKTHARRSFANQTSMTIAELLKLKKSQTAANASNLLVLSESNPLDSKDKIPTLVEIFINKFNAVPKHLIMLSISQTKDPTVGDADRYTVKTFENDAKTDNSVISVKARFGFNEEPDVEKVIQYIADNEELTPNHSMVDWIVYVGRERVIIPTKEQASFLTRLRAKSYSFMMRNTPSMYDYFGLGTDTRLTVELVKVTIK
jgi:KUP system potassium uptake protein